MVEPFNIMTVEEVIRRLETLQPGDHIKVSIVADQDDRDRILSEFPFICYELYHDTINGRVLLTYGKFRITIKIVHSGIEILLTN